MVDIVPDSFDVRFDIKSYKFDVFFENLSQERSTIDHIWIDPIDLFAMRDAESRQEREILSRSRDS